MPTRSACCGLRYRFGASHCSRTLRMPHASGYQTNSVYPKLNPVSY
ncbi:MAG: hypothetical protein NZ455_07910 [Bacteroidia bacterium]|nr:hypothetical protein [Bacteroidia bacterium]MDW8345685.1 hypothetical protein [Bacteroidia bacterium]